MYDLSLVVPTYNERHNITPLLTALTSALEGVNWEVIFVDDNSPDGTAEFIRQLSCEANNVRVIQRVHKKGLSSACIDGILASKAEYVAIMDADLQHDEKLLLDMYASLKNEEADLVIASRYVSGGSTGELRKIRVLISQTASWFGKFVLKQEVKDPMSGFFMFKRELILPQLASLSGVGFKILLDILATSAGKLRIKEIPFVMRARHSGESKLGPVVIWEYFLLLINKMVGNFVPIRFVMFSFVGLMGVLVHMITLGVFFRIIEWQFVYAQTMAVIVAMTTNYILNNIYTYKDRRLTGGKFIIGLFVFYAICSVGAFVNVTIADYIYEQGAYWPLAGGVGLVIGSVWNYALSSSLAWREG